jgi:hypothetical protein
MLDNLYKTEMVIIVVDIDKETAKEFTCQALRKKKKRFS